MRHMHGKANDTLHIPVINDTSLWNANTPGEEAAYIVTG